MVDRAEIVTGWSASSGWAVSVALRGSVDEPEIVGRWAHPLLDRDDPAQRQPYHASQGLPLEEAQRRIEACEQRSREFADIAVDEVAKHVGDLDQAGLVAGAGRLRSTLERILESHVQLHMAEGELHRNAVRRALVAWGAVPVEFVGRDLYATAAGALGLTESEVRRRITELGKPVGPPWKKEHKEAALTAWLVLGEARAGR